MFLIIFVGTTFIPASKKNSRSKNILKPKNRKRSGLSVPAGPGRAPGPAPPPLPSGHRARSVEPRETGSFLGYCACSRRTRVRMRGTRTNTLTPPVRPRRPMKARCPRPTSKSDAGAKKIDSDRANNSCVQLSQVKKPCIEGFHMK